jgi:hypothetical protein
MTLEKSYNRMANRAREMSAGDWEKTTWEGQRRYQINRWVKLSLDEILEAQEEMAALANEISTAKRRLKKVGVVFEKPAVYKTNPRKSLKKKS